VTAPNVVGAGRTAAAGILGAVGLSLGNERDLPDSNCAQIGTILDQSPGAGSTAVSGSTVNYTLAVRPSGPLHCS
jgi:beta-lactam-binding protein with PASTA domain